MSLQIWAVVPHDKDGLELSVCVPRAGVNDKLPVEAGKGSVGSTFDLGPSAQPTSFVVALWQKNWMELIGHIVVDLQTQHKYKSEYKETLRKRTVAVRWKYTGTQGSNREEPPMTPHETKLALSKPMLPAGAADIKVEVLYRQKAAGAHGLEEDDDDDDNETYSEDGAAPTPQAGRRSGGSNPAAAAHAADVLHKAMKGMGTDEDAIFAALKSVDTQAAWRDVQDTFRTKYPSFEDGDLLKALQSELSASEMRRCEQTLKENGVQLVEPEKMRPEDVAARLHKAMKGMGTDEDAIFAALKSVDTQAAWRDVQDTFRMQYPSFEDGDLLKALQSELSASEMRRCEQTLKENGVQLVEPEKMRPEDVATRLHKAMKGMGTDEDAIFKALGTVRSQKMWLQTAKAFHAAYPSFEAGDVVRALESELSGSDLKRCEEILSASGAVLRGASSATAAVAAEGHTCELLCAGKTFRSTCASDSQASRFAFPVVTREDVAVLRLKLAGSAGGGGAVPPLLLRVSRAFFRSASLAEEHAGSGAADSAAADADAALQEPASKVYALDAACKWRIEPEGGDARFAGDVVAVRVTLVSLDVAAAAADAAAAVPKNGAVVVMGRVTPPDAAGDYTPCFSVRSQLPVLARRSAECPSYWPYWNETFLFPADGAAASAGSPVVHAIEVLKDDAVVGKVKLPSSGVGEGWVVSATTSPKGSGGVRGGGWPAFELYCKWNFGKATGKTGASAAATQPQQQQQQPPRHAASSPAASASPADGALTLVIRGIRARRLVDAAGSTPQSVVAGFITGAAVSRFPSTVPSTDGVWTWLPTPALRATLTSAEEPFGVSVMEDIDGSPIGTVYAVLTPAQREEAQRTDVRLSLDLLAANKEFAGDCELVLRVATGAAGAAAKGKKKKNAGGVGGGGGGGSDLLSPSASVASTARRPGASKAQKGVLLFSVAQFKKAGSGGAAMEAVPDAVAKVKVGTRAPDVKEHRVGGSVVFDLPRLRELVCVRLSEGGGQVSFLVEPTVRGSSFATTHREGWVPLQKDPGPYFDKLQPQPAAYGFAYVRYTLEVREGRDLHELPSGRDFEHHQLFSALVSAASPAPAGSGGAAAAARGGKGRGRRAGGGGGGGGGTGGSSIFYLRVNRVVLTAEEQGAGGEGEVSADEQKRRYAVRARLLPNGRVEHDVPLRTKVKFRGQRNPTEILLTVYRRRRGAAAEAGREDAAAEAELAPPTAVSDTDIVGLVTIPLCPAESSDPGGVTLPLMKYAGVVGRVSLRWEREDVLDEPPVPPSAQYATPLQPSSTGSAAGQGRHQSPHAFTKARSGSGGKGAARRALSPGASGNGGGVDYLPAVPAAHRSSGDGGRSAAQTQSLPPGGAATQGRNTNFLRRGEGVGGRGARSASPVYEDVFDAAYERRKEQEQEDLRRRRADHRGNDMYSSAAAAATAGSARSVRQPQPHTRASPSPSPPRQPRQASTARSPLFPAATPQPQPQPRSPLSQPSHVDAKYAQLKKEYAALQADYDGVCGENQALRAQVREARRAAADAGAATEDAAEANARLRRASAGEERLRREAAELDAEVRRLRDAAAPLAQQRPAAAPAAAAADAADAAALRGENRSLLEELAALNARLRAETQRAREAEQQAEQQQRVAKQLHESEQQLRLQVAGMRRDIAASVPLFQKAMADVAVLHSAQQQQQQQQSPIADAYAVAHSSRDLPPHFQYVPRL